MAFGTLSAGKDRVDLTEEMVEAITDGDLFDRRYIQPHVEIAARIAAASLDALDRGDYVLVARPARAIGTLTARFLTLTGDQQMERLVREVPVLYEGALPVQVSCPPLYVRGQNVARLPELLPDVLRLAEFPEPAGRRMLSPGDLEVTATRHGLLLLDSHSGQVIEPQVLHALALDHQMPPLARFVAHLPRAYAAGYTGFDWGPAASGLPHLPEVRFGRVVLSSERWHLNAADVPGSGAQILAWHDALHRWRAAHDCPDTAELADGDMTLRLDLTEPAHALILREFLAEKTTATLIRAAAEEEFGWIGRAHEVAVPLIRSGPAAPTQLTGPLPRVTNQDGHFPACADANWLSVRIHTHPDLIDEIIADHVPQLNLGVGEEPLWLVRYRNPEEPDHLRIRIRTCGSGQFAAHSAAVGDWAAHLRDAGLIGRMLFDTYYPEVGRYGHGAAMAAAEDVFAADTLAAISTLSQPPAGLHPDTVTALAMLDIAEAFLGGMAPAAVFFTGRTAGDPQTIDHDAVTATTRLARAGTPRDLAQLPAGLAARWADRADALAAYRKTLPPDADIDTALNSVLHLHYNRHRSMNRKHEAACARLARSAALAWLSTQAEGTS